MRCFFPPLIFGPNLIYSSVVCDCCGCVRSVFAVILELQCILVCSGRLTASLSQLPETLSKPTSVCTGGPGFKHLKHTHTHTTRELAHDAIVLGIVTAQGDAEQF